VRLDLQIGAGRGAVDHSGEAGRGERRSPLADEDESATTACGLQSARARSPSHYRLPCLGSELAEPVVVLGGLLRSASNGSALWISRASLLISRQDNRRAASGLHANA
jgi:hypothetical protein